MVSGLGVVGEPTERLAAGIRVEDENLPVAAEDGETSSVGAVSEAPGLGGERRPPSDLPARPIPDDDLLTRLRRPAACIGGGDRSPVR
jgi:hypothetical protein